jgi:hypothetical protein
LIEIRGIAYSNWAISRMLRHCPWPEQSLGQRTT